MVGVGGGAGSRAENLALIGRAEATVKCKSKEGSAGNQGQLFILLFLPALPATAIIIHPNSLQSDV